MSVVIRRRISFVRLLLIVVVKSLFSISRPPEYVALCPGLHGYGLGV
jgi:hypothetical protein